jgi:exodeoxyribonuclease V beta subunit
VDAGIPCIVKSAGSVFGSVSARELLYLLRAVVTPGNDGSVSAALISSTLGHTATGLAELKQETASYGAIADRLLYLRKLWEGSQNGFMRMATALLYEGGLAAGGAPVAEHVLAFVDAERRLTDLLHLIELLHQESILHPGPDHLVHWLERQIADLTKENEEASIRLETDAQRVQIVTVHSSKGLEYPVVFCPFTYEGSDVKLAKKGIVFCHDEQDMAAIGRGEIPVLTADCGSAERTEHHARHKQEARSEDIRLLYVALTRARQRCYVVWGLVNNMEDAALSRLLFDDPDRAVLKGLGHSGVIAPVLRMVKASGGAMSSSQVVPNPRLAAATAADAEMHDAAHLHARVFERSSVPASWQYTSYTSLTSDWVRSGKDTDGAVTGPETGPAPGDSIFAFPSGARTGKVWHRFFEHLDLGGTDEQTAAAVEKMVKRNSFDPVFVPAVNAMVRATLDQPLGPSGFRLRDVDTRSCVRELDFIYACRRYMTADVRAALGHPGAGVDPLFIRAAGGLRDRDIRGFMIGTIDLLVHHDGRFYILDYKSNNLGSSPEHYNRRGMMDAIAREHYYLQYLIYTIAVHRYLRTRIPGYAYEEHFGGVYYLFLRGMSAGTGQGVFFDRPSLTLVTALESRLMPAEVK